MWPTIITQSFTSSFYQIPETVQKWEKLAEKELQKSKSKHSLSSLRTNRISPEGIEIQPVYFDLNDTPNPEMPGIEPYTR